MNPLILVVEDNPDILFTIKLSLESNDLQVVSAENGKDALNMLSNIKSPPDLIVSDIMMDEMDGYELFKAVSNNPLLSDIPFIFLSAKASPSDIRFGKILGVDDYITKPFREEDLLAVIWGKLNRRKKIDSINISFNNLLKSQGIDITPSFSEKEEMDLILLKVIWDDYKGPTLSKIYPKKDLFQVPMKEIGQQLFQAAVSIYGHEDINRAEGILINIENIKKKGYIYFDAYPDKETRAGERQFMLAVIASNINYFESLKIRELLCTISSKIKDKKEWDIKLYWQKLSGLLTSPLL